MNKLIVLFAIGCLINGSLAARLPREVDSSDSSSSSEEEAIPSGLKMIIENSAREKNFTLTETQLSQVSEILNKESSKKIIEMVNLTRSDVEQFKVELSAVVPAEVAENVSIMLSKFTKEATPEEALEGFGLVLMNMFGGLLASIGETDTTATNATATNTAATAA